MFGWRRQKVFCIGRNKTGTTSLLEAMKTLGYRVGDQPRAERLVEDWGRRDFRKIVRYCRSADFFQDVPFSLNFTFQAVDQAFPNSRFILTVRDDADQWFRSLTRFHTKLFGKGRLPTAKDMKEFSYRGRGWIWRAHRIIYDVDESNLYDRDRYVAHYEQHIDAVEDYFRGRPNDLLVLNLAQVDAMDRLGEFLGIDPGEIEMPHLNRSDD